MTATESVVLVCACVAFFVAASAAAAQDAGREANVAMSVEISITHTVIDEEGNMVLPAPTPVVFTVARERRSAGWRTVVAYRKQSGVSTRASAHPLDGARVEFDEVAGATRVYDSTGDLNSLLSSDSTGGLPAARGPGQWLDGLVATADSRSRRSRDLQDKYGNPVERLAGLDRFLTERDGTVEEVLVDPRSALPIEINTVRDGSLASHVVFDYQRRADGAWIRRRMRAEHALPGGSGRRSRMTVDFTNLSTGRR
ncbi:MAG TPA: hypothetical protein VMO26_28135 [Vicinamibacterales bacterium]|nr:hypothetical protein [Vicinamibacterales bacterium]